MVEPLAEPLRVKLNMLVLRHPVKGRIEGVRSKLGVSVNSYLQLTVGGLEVTEPVPGLPQHAM